MSCTAFEVDKCLKQDGQKYKNFVSESIFINTKPAITCTAFTWVIVILSGQNGEPMATSIMYLYFFHFLWKENSELYGTHIKGMRQIKRNIRYCKNWG